MIDSVIPNRVYTHYKGGRYLVLSIAHESSNARNGNLVVVYVSLANGRMNTRDLSEFLEPISWPDGTLRARFIPEEESMSHE